MENPNAQQVMGPQASHLRAKITTFNGNGNFPTWQHQVQNSYVSNWPNPMDPKSLLMFEQLVNSIAITESRIKAYKPVDKITTREQQLLAAQNELDVPQLAEFKRQQFAWQKEDLTFYIIVQSAIAGPANIIAQGQIEAFQLVATPQLQGALAYERLRKEYTKDASHIFERYGQEELLKENFVKPNLSSPQIEVILNDKVSQFALKFGVKGVVLNDTYLKMLCVFLHHLPPENIYETVLLKYRAAVAGEEIKEQGAKELFLAAIKEAQVVFKINKEIQKEAMSLKAMVGKIPHQNGRKAHNAAPVATAAKSSAAGASAAAGVKTVKNQQQQQQQVDKPKLYCLKFNSPNGCPHPNCRYDHSIAPKAVLEQMRAQMKEHRASMALFVKENTPSSSIKGSDFYCSLSSSTPKLGMHESYLDTGASNTMSPYKSMFTDLMSSRIEIQCANDNKIYSTMVGVFHLPTVLSNGQSIILHIKNALLVPKLAATLVSDRSLIHLNYSILLGKEKQVLQNDTKKIELLRHASGIIYFPSPTKVQAAVATSITSVVQSAIPIADNIINVQPDANTNAVVVPLLSNVTTKVSLPTKSLLKTMSLSDLHMKHASMGHVNIDSTIEILRGQGYSISTKQRQAFSCPHCAEAKSKALPLHSQGASSLRSVKELDRNTKTVTTIHTDIAGPITPVTLANEKYIISFRNETNNLLWTASFTSLTQVVPLTKQYIQDMSNAILSTPIVPNATVLLSDSAAVYLAPKMKELLAQHKIITAASAPYHPKGNSVSERGWQTVIGLARSMLLGAKQQTSFITNSFWPQAVQHATLIINLTSLSHGSNEKSAFENITNKSPNEILSKLLPFGCPVVVKTETKHTKLESNGHPAIIVGYDLTSQAHLVYNMDTGRTTTTVNVKSDLSSFYHNQSGDPIQPIQPDVFYELPSAIIQDDLAPNTLSDVVDMLISDKSIITPQCDRLEDVENFRESPQRATFDVFDTPLNSPSGVAFLTAPPSSIAKALQGPDRDKWMQSLAKELKSMDDNAVYIAVKDEGQPRMQSFVLIRIKPDDGSGSGELFKSRLVAGGNTQQAGRDYDPARISSSVLKTSSMKLIMCYALEWGWYVYHLDVITAFLNSPSEFVNYMALPKLLVDELGAPPLVRLLKGLYGTHDGPLLWWQLLHNVLVQELDFVQSTNDPCLYFHKIKKAALGVYVDDMPLAASKEDHLWVVQELTKRFKITDKGILTRCLGMDCVQTIEDGKVIEIKLHQGPYIGDVLERFGFQHCTPVFTPAVPNTFLTADMPNYIHQAKDYNSSKLSLELYPSLVGSLLWISISTRPEISQAVLQLCRQVHKPCLAHLTAAKHVLRFLAGSRDNGLTYRKSANKTPMIFSDATWGSDPTTQRSMSAYVVVLFGAAISWHCGLQPSVSLSTTESEWYALSETVKEAVYMKHALLQFGFAGVQHWKHQPIIIKEDNQAVIKIAISGEPKHKHQKHLLLRLAYVREHVQSGIILPEFVPSAQNWADVLTKNLPKDTFKLLSAKLLG